MEKLKRLVEKIKNKSLSILNVGSVAISSAVSIMKILLVLTTIIISFMFGARMFETGNLGLKKGSTVYISGVCLLNNEIREPALAEDQVKITSLNNGKISGVIRKTREAIVCDMNKVSIGTIPITQNIAKPLDEIPEAVPVQKDPLKDEAMSLIKRTVNITGICQDRKTKNIQTFTDKIVDIVNVSRDPKTNEYIVYGIRKDTNSAIKCGFNSIKYSTPTNTEKQKEKHSSSKDVGKHKEVEKIDLRGEMILVTSTCFPDKRLSKYKKDDVLFYPLVNSLVQVLDYTETKTGEIDTLTGVLVKQNAMITCDSKEYPIVYRKYDPNKHEIINLKGSKNE